MRPFLGVVGSVVLLLGAVGCGGAGTATSSSATGSTSAAGSEVALEKCPGEVPGVFAIEPSGALRWSRCDESGSNQLMTVTVADGLGYVVEQSSAEPSLVALDIDDGTEVWRFAFSALNEGFGYDAVYASDKASFAASGVIVLDVPASTGVDHVGLDAQTGEQRWRIPDDGGLVTLNTDELVVTSVGFGGDLAGSGPTGPVAAYDRHSGERRWSVDDVPYFGGAFGARLAGDTMVVQGFADAAPAGVMGVDLATGKELWRHGDRFWLKSAAADVVLGVAGDSPSGGDLVALAPSDGTELWRVSAASFSDAASTASTTATSGAEQGAPFFVNPLVVGNVVVVQAGLVLVGFDARSGDERWRRETTLQTVAGGDGNLLLYEAGTGLALIRVDDGTTRWNAALADDINVQAVVTEQVTVLSVVRIQMQPPANSGSAPAYEDPVTLSVGCAGGTLLSGAFIAPIGAAQPVFGLSVLVSADESNFCIIDSSGTEDVVPFERGRVVSEPEATIVQGVLSDYLVVAVPSEWGQNPQVSTGQGQQLSSAITPDGTVMLVVDFAPLGATPDQYVSRTFTFTGSENQILDKVTISAPPTGSMEDALACLAQHGVHVAPLGMPDTGPLDKQPLDPAVANAAWTACRPIVMLTFQASGQSLPQPALDSLDCMATKGFIEIFTAGQIDEAARAEAMSECRASLPIAKGELRCDVYTIGSDGAISAEPVLSNLGGFGMGAKATAPATATMGVPVTVTIEANVGQLIDSAVGFEILDHRDMVRTFTVTGATIVPGSLVQDAPTDARAETTATATDATASLGWVTPIVGGGDMAFPAARFDIVANAPGAVTIAFSGYDNTMQVRGSDGVEIRVRAICTTGDRNLTTITVS